MNLEHDRPLAGAGAASPSQTRRPRALPPALAHLPRAGGSRTRRTAATSARSLTLGTAALLLAGCAPPDRGVAAASAPVLHVANPPMVGAPQLGRLAPSPGRRGRRLYCVEAAPGPEDADPIGITLGSPQ
jgi:hypothetical protein